MTLERETAAYLEGLAAWIPSRLGQYVVICGEARDFFPTFDAALTAGYERFDQRPFLVKKIVSRDHLERFAPQKLAVQ